MTSTELENTAKRMQQKWYDLVKAEQQGASTQVLERKYRAYILIAEEYNRCCEAEDHHLGLAASQPYSPERKTDELKAQTIPGMHKMREMPTTPPSSTDTPCERKKWAS